MHYDPNTAKGFQYVKRGPEDGELIREPRRNKPTKRSFRGLMMTLTPYGLLALMAIIGYARVSLAEQNPDLQVDALRVAGARTGLR